MRCVYIYLDCTAVGGGEEGERNGEEAIDDENVLLSKPLRPLAWVETHQLLYC